MGVAPWLQVSLCFVYNNVLLHGQHDDWPQVLDAKALEEKRYTLARHVRQVASGEFRRFLLAKDAQIAQVRGGCPVNNKPLAIYSNHQAECRHQDFVVKIASLHHTARLMHEVAVTHLLCFLLSHLTKANSSMSA
jgi:hypothetical protein